MIRALAAACLALAVQGASAQLALRDDRGVEVVLAVPATRIVALAPHLAEIAFAAGAGAKVVGVSAHSDFPAAAVQLPVISDATHVDFEALALLKPDLVLAWRSGSRARDVAQLEARGFRVYSTEAGALEDVPRLVRAVGRLAGTSAIADRRAGEIEAELDAIRRRHAGRPEVRVFYEIWHDPLMTVSGRHLVSGMLALCGGANVFADAQPLTPVISREQVLAANPDAILLSAPPDQARATAASWRQFKTLRAVQRNQLHAMDPALINRMGPRVVEGAEAICSTLEQVRKAGAN
ncbi:MAG TPA: cobalamin-binding protein [Burkholderiales bacterium]|nr:cobalamin-binding protein [Burkholderiales bacterium]